jgi:hypothetical protein
MKGDKGLRAEVRGGKPSAVFDIAILIEVIDRDDNRRINSVISC